MCTHSPLSAGSQYGGANELFYNQFDLHTREQKVAQIVFLEVSQWLLYF